jgi:hypothetical protein
MVASFLRRSCAAKAHAHAVGFWLGRQAPEADDPWNSARVLHLHERLFASGRLPPREHPRTLHPTGAETAPPSSSEFRDVRRIAIGRWPTDSCVVLLCRSSFVVPSLRSHRVARAGYSAALRADRRRTCTGAPQPPFMEAAGACSPRWHRRSMWYSAYSRWGALDTYAGLALRSARGVRLAIY